MYLTYESLMSLSLDQIREIFPNGASAEGTGVVARWKPAEGEPDRTLKRLLRDKRSRIEKPRLLHRDSTHGYTDSPALALLREPEAIDKETQIQFSKEAWENFTPEERPLSERVAELEDDLQPKQAAKLKKHVRSLERSVVR